MNIIECDFCNRTINRETETSSSSRGRAAVSSPHAFGQISVAGGDLVEPPPRFGFVAPIVADGVLGAFVRERIRLAPAAMQVVEMTVPSLENGEPIAAREQKIRRPLV